MATAQEADTENVLAAERGSVDEYIQQRERIEDADVLTGLRELDGAGTTKWEAWRVGATGSVKNGWVADVPTEMLTMQHLANVLGPGTYQIVGKVNGRYASRRTIRIAGDAVREPESLAVDAPAGNRSGAFDLEEWERRQEARDERRRKERNELLALVIPAMAPIVAAMVGRQGPDIATLVTALKGPTMPEMMTALASLKSLAPEQTSDPIDRAMKVLDLIQDRAPVGQGESGWLDIVKEVIRTLGPTMGPALMAKIEAQQNATSSPAAGARLLSPTPPAPVAGLPAPSAAGASAGENPEMLALLMWLRTQLTMALTKAAKGTDPVFVADRILDDVPDTVDARELLQFVAREDWFQQLCRFEPKCAQFPDWFGQMRAAMLDSETDVAGVAGTQGAPTLSSSAPAAPAMTVTGEGVQTKIDRPPAGPPSLTGK